MTSNWEKKANKQKWINEYVMELRGESFMAFIEDYPNSSSRAAKRTLLTIQFSKLTKGQYRAS